jgi:hypothetical protein
MQLPVVHTYQISQRKIKAGPLRPVTGQGDQVKLGRFRICNLHRSFSHSSRMPEDLPR